MAGVERAAVRAVVCDADAPTRSMVSAAVEAVAGEVLAETDHSLAAADLIDRFDANLVVVDTNLAVGSGADVVRHVRERAVPCQVVVFTAFPDTVRFLEGAATRVVGKPDLGSLRAALAAAAADLGAGAVGERRRPTRVVPPATIRSDEGLDDPAQFYAALADAQPGDALVGLDLCGVAPATLGAAVRAVVRVQDRVTVRQGRLVVLLVGGGTDGAGAVVGRLAETHPGPAATASLVVLDDGVDTMAALRAVSQPL